MLIRKSFAIVAMLLTFSACYHATIQTGLTPSAQTIEQNWASGWIYGLVPPSTVETMQGCPSGVARVETVRTLANSVVGILTLMIYTPMTIVVTCADGRGASSVTTKEEFETAITTGEPFLVQTHVE